MTHNIFPNLVLQKMAEDTTAFAERDGQCTELELLMQFQAYSD